MCCSFSIWFLGGHIPPKRDVLTFDKTSYYKLLLLTPSRFPSQLNIQNRTEFLKVVPSPSEQTGSGVTTTRDRVCYVGPKNSAHSIRADRAFPALELLEQTNCYTSYCTLSPAVAETQGHRLVQLNLASKSLSSSIQAESTATAQSSSLSPSSDSSAAASLASELSSTLSRSSDSSVSESSSLVSAATDSSSSSSEASESKTDPLKSLVNPVLCHLAHIAYVSWDFHSFHTNTYLSTWSTS